MKEKQVSSDLNKWATLVYGQYYSGIILTLQDVNCINEDLLITNGKDPESCDSKKKHFGNRWC
jgi:hypothetical protein